MPQVPDDQLSIKDRGWVSLKQFAKVANVTYMTARRWANLEMIRTKKVGGITRIYEDELARFLRDGTLAPNKEKHQAEKNYRAKYQPGSPARKDAQPQSQSQNQNGNLPKGSGTS